MPEKIVSTRKAGRTLSKLQAHIQQEFHVKPSVTPEEEVRNRIDFIKRYVTQTSAKGLVLGISGGQDSSLCGRLCQLAVEELREETGKNYTFIAMRLPYGRQQDDADAERALAFIQPDRCITLNIKEPVDASVRAFEAATGEKITDYLKGNIKARERMKAQYDVAGFYQLLVAGTDHAAEAVTGFFTKFGDGGCDLVPLFGLTKRQGQALLKYLGADDAIYTKKPTADLLDDNPGRPDEDELGLRYTDIDDYLEGKKVEGDIAQKIESKYLATRHKRKLPVTPFDTWWT